MLGNRWGYVAPSPAGRNRTVVDEVAPDIFDSVLVMVVGTLLMWRLLVPTEGSPAGETLWITQLWPVALVLWGIAQYRADTWRIRWNWLDGLVWLLVGGHVISAIRVLLTLGDKRSALNMLCEWIGLGVMFFLVRQVLVDRTDRRNLALMLIAAAMTLSGLGLYQHFFGYQKLQQDFEKVEKQWRQLDHLESQGPPENQRARADWEAARNKVFQELEQQKIPSDPHARMMYRQRVQESTEPYGMFALANSFAGLLVCWLVVCIGVLVEGWRRGLPVRVWLVAALLTAAVAFCLVLTKSRTAYVGLLAGLVAWGFGLARSLASNPQRILCWGLVGLGTVLLVGGLAWATGGVDRLVLSESGKSLRYRFEYWRGTWGVLRESPANFVVGVGPGNFRQHYLAHKLPESSEEVLDPHNMVLDAWANGGLLALIALGGLCVAAGALVLRRTSDSADLASSLQQVGDGERKEGAPGSHSLANSSAKEPESQVVINGFILGGGLGFLAAYLTGNSFDYDNPLPFLAVGWGVAVAFCGKFFREIDVNPSLLGAAALALLVHLLGAGGIGMPGITQTLLVLLALGYAEVEEAAPGVAGLRLGKGRQVPAIAMTVGIVLAAGCLVSASWPVTTRDNALAEASNALTSRRNVEEATAAYSRAAEADPLSSETRQKQAVLALQMALGSTKPSEAETWMEKAVSYQQAAIDRDPLNAGNYRALGDFELEFGRRTNSVVWLEGAAAAYAQALSRYPNNAAMQAELARAWWLANKPSLARPAAERALELHAINVQAGHPDKLLPAPRLEMLHKILETSTSGPGFPDEKARTSGSEASAHGSN